MERLPNIHPGEVLQEDFLTPLGISAYRLARDIHVPATRVSDILRGKRRISADTAMRLARYFKTPPQFWMNLQALYDLEETSRTAVQADIESIRPHPDIAVG